MNAPAVSQAKPDRDLAVQCLVVMHQVTAELLVAAAQGKPMKLHQLIAAWQLPVLAREFVEACGAAPSTYTSKGRPASIARTLRILGELHVLVSGLLTHSALSPHWEAIDDETTVRQVHDVVVEFGASIEA